ncbi:hypothetical protein MU516_14045 [Paracoccus sp. YLB-12]|uniref:Uncharacterized protein n=1 Tax=Paracoccus maritimus TaxID=2933292 RepID=A0ABT2KBS5_9RHOB|nr:hypothetical protein [Paracoccus sp. YLB-12]MCT4333984.1 hypothetical protein [Paracoccus sp. YLB-12]
MRSPVRMGYLFTPGHAEQARRSAGSSAPAGVGDRHLAKRPGAVPHDIPWVDRNLRRFAPPDTGSSARNSAYALSGRKIAHTPIWAGQFSPDQFQINVNTLFYINNKIPIFKSKTHGQLREAGSLSVQVENIKETTRHACGCFMASTDAELSTQSC